MAGPRQFVVPLSLQPSAIAPGARLFSDRYELIRGLGPRGGAVAEVGVAFGFFSEFLVNTLGPTRFDAFDLFILKPGDEMMGQDTAAILNGQSHLDYYAAKMATLIPPAQMNVYVGDSAEQLRLVEDDSYDLVYVDANHAIAAVKADLAEAIRVCEPDGLIVLNDYILFDTFWGHPYGVVQVVNELLFEGQFHVVGFAFHHEMFCDVAIQRV